MKKYTQKEFDAIERDEHGIKHCQSGDYSEIKNFGEWCSFGERCLICDRKMKDEFVRSMSGLGEHRRTLYVWNTEDGVYCQTGCFFGTKEDFFKAVTEKYNENHAYIKAVNFLMEI